MEFIGVSTERSSIHRLFPLWAEILETPHARLSGTDLPLQADHELYRATVARIAADETVDGGLVTSHKVGLFAAAGHLFAELDDYARACAEVSCISKKAGRLVGHAKDPVTAGRTLESMLGDGYFGRTGGHVVCLGAGGAGVALAVCLLSRSKAADRPTRLVFTDTSGERLRAAQAACERIGKRGVTVETVHVSGNGGESDNDALVMQAPPASLVVNATGMGKDLPGSPISDATLFPAGSVAWDLNYRGALDFLRQARKQPVTARVQVEDGWLYFLHGWSEHMTEVFGLALTPDRFTRLRQAAEEWRAGRSQ